MIAEHLGDAYMKLKRYKEAAKAYQQSLSNKHPRPDEVRAKLKEAKRLQGSE